MTTSPVRKASFQYERIPTPDINKKLYASKKEVLPPLNSAFPAKLRHSTSLASNMDLFEDPGELQWIAPKKWDTSLKRNVLCEFCGGAVSILKRVDAACAYCNVVAHIRCFDPNCTDFSQHADWICSECQDEINVSRGHFLNKQSVLIRERNVHIAQTTIAKNFRRHLTQRRYRIFSRSLLHLQSYARIIHRQHIFKEMRKLMLRPLRVEVANCQGFDIEADNESTPLLTIAVIEPAKRDKVVWYFCVESHDKLNPQFEYAKVLIPGICAKHTLIISIILRGEKRNTILGQATISLNEGNSWLNGGVYNLTLDAPEFFLKEFGNVIEPEKEKRGSLEFHLEALSGLRAECGSILGPNLDTYLKIAHGLKRSNNGMRVIKALSKSKTNSSSGGSESLADGSLSRFWCCVCDGYLYMYTRMGAALRAVVDLKVATLQFILDDLGTADRLTVSIKMAGLPPLILAVGDHIESWRWRFALLSSYRFAKDPTVIYDIYENRKEMVEMYAELSSEGLKKYLAIQEAKQAKKRDHPEETRRVARQSSMIARAPLGKDRDKDSNKSTPRSSISPSSSMDSHDSPRHASNAGGNPGLGASSLLRTDTPTSPRSKGDDTNTKPGSSGGHIQKRHPSMNRMASISTI